MSRFDRAVRYVLENEGGYACDERDSGGETKFGVSKRAHPEIDVARLTRNEAVEIYRTHYWKRAYEAIEDEVLAIKLFDLAVNMGHRGAHTLLQEAVNALGEHRLLVDGILGPLTLRATNASHRASLFNRLLCKADDYYRSLRKPEFLRGWLDRLYRRVE
jgi:lysozyme family protein